MRAITGYVHEHGCDYPVTPEQAAQLAAKDLIVACHQDDPDLCARAGELHYHFSDSTREEFAGDVRSAYIHFDQTLTGKTA